MTSDNRRDPVRLRPLAALFALALGVFASAASAQVAPPAPQQAGRPDPAAIGSGLIRQGQTFQQQQAPGSGAAPITGDTNAAGKPQAGPTVSFRLRQVQFGPSRFIARAQMDRLAARYLGKTVSFADLQRLVASLNAIYARRGLVTARAFLPPQRVHDGLLRIDFLEGRLGRLTVTKGHYTSAAYASRALRTRSGDVIDLADLRRRVQIFNRTNDAQLRLQLTPGAEAGLTDIGVAVIDAPRTALQIFVDNQGYNSTGRGEVGAFLRRSRLLFDGDRFTGYGVYSDGAITGALTYGVATDASGGRATISASRSDIHVVNGAQQALDVRGVSDTYSLTYAKPLLGGDTWGVTLSGTGAYIRSQDDVTGVTTGTSIVKKVSGGVSAFAPVGRFGRVTGDLILSHADISQRVGFGAKTLNEINGDFDFVSVPVFGATLRMAGVAQYDDRKDVPGTQLFQVGGVNSIRGYEPGALSGSSGFALQTEAHYNVSPFKTLPVDGFAFFDGGDVHLITGQHRTLRGAGVGLNIPFDRVSLQTTYGHAFDDLPLRRASDRIDARIVLSF